MAVKRSSGKETNVAAEPQKLQKYPLHMLKDNCMTLFGVTSSTFAGATSGLGDGRYTISEVKNKIEAWLKKEVR